MTDLKTMWMEAFAEGTWETRAMVVYMMMLPVFLVGYSGLVISRLP